MAAQQGRSERRGESYSVPYVEPLSDERTPLAGYFRILLEPALQLLASGRTEQNIKVVPRVFLFALYLADGRLW
mgnify:CR=1 FL=1